MFTLDDGTQVYEDAAGNVTVYQAPGGAPYAPDRSIAGEFVSTLTTGLNLKLRQALGLTPLPASAPRAATAAAFPLAPVLFIAVAGFIAYKFLAK